MPLTKAEYDRQYRERNKAVLQAKKAQWFKADYALNPEKYKAKRMAKKEKHLAYCRKPEYKEKKKIYDRKLRFGEYEECQRIMSEIFEIVREHYPTPYERRKARGYYDKII